jgi:hypothetical protein
MTEGNFIKKAGGPGLNDRNFKDETSFFVRYSSFSPKVRKNHRL